MGATKLVLDYASPPGSPPQKLTIEESDGCVRVIFPVMPNWVYICNIVGPFVIGWIHLTGAVAIAMITWHFASQIGVADARRSLLNAVLCYGASTLFWRVCVWYEWRMYRRWGRVPRALTITTYDMTLSRLAWGRMRERTWLANEIQAIEFRQVRWNLNRKQTAAVLYVRRHKGRPLRFLFSSSDPEFPSHIAE